MISRLLNKSSKLDKIVYNFNKIIDDLATLQENNNEEIKLCDNIIDDSNFRKCELIRENNRASAIHGNITALLKVA